MILLAQLLIRQRWRKARRQYGLATAATVGSLLLLGVWRLSLSLSRFLAVSTAERLGLVLASLWAGWILLGVLTGKDLTWHARLDRLIQFPAPFPRLYALDLALSFLTFPLLLLCAVFEILAWRRGLSLVIVTAAFVLFACAVRLTVSIVRSALNRGSLLGRAWSFLAVALAAGSILLAIYRPEAISIYLPSGALQAALLGQSAVRSLSVLIVTVGALIAIDFAMQRRLVYSGVRGPVSSTAARSARGRFLLVYPRRISTLWRVSMLGWLRNRNALLLLLWGVTYGFFYTYLTKASGTSYFFLFCWMVLIFHSYLRGNLLGVDHRATWLYFVLPVPAENVIRAKNSSLTSLQAMMVGSVLLPALLRTTAGMTTPLQWVSVLSFAWSCILIGEVAGAFFSLLHPEPIERGSTYSGGTTMGAIVIPILQVVVLSIFLITMYFSRIHRVSIEATWALCIAIPALLMIIRTIVVPQWAHFTLLREKEEILMKLSAFTA